MGLRAKFNIVMLIAFLCGLGLAAALAHNLLLQNARSAVLQEAAVMMGQAGAISAYTDKEIAPLLAEQLKVRFLPQSIPFAVAQANFRQLQEQFPDYSLRIPATNPTNPADRPTDWQEDIIETFRQHSTQKSLVTTRDTPTGPILSYAHPVRLTDKSCLACHSTPAAAPTSLTDLYGTNNGFGWKLGDTVGAYVVSVPMRVPLERANRAFYTMMTGLAVVFLIMMIVLNVLLEFTIVRPARRIAAAASDVSLGNMEAPEVVVNGRDEIASLADSFNRMRRSLANAMKMLEDRS